MKKAIILFFCIFLSRATYAQDKDSIIQWQHTYNGLGECIIASVVNTLDGGYIAVGYTDSSDLYNTYPSDVIVLKLKHDGSTEWKRTYGGSDDDIGYSIIATSDSGFVFIGYTESTDGDIKKNHGNADIWVVKLKPNGNIQWEKTYGGKNNDIPAIMRTTNDSGFIFTGYTSSIDGDVKNNNGDEDVCAVKLKKDGALEWFRTYGGMYMDKGTEIVQIKDSSFMLLASSRSNEFDVSGHHGDYHTEDIWILKLGKTGNVLWQKSYGGSDIDVPSCIITTIDNGYLIAGTTWSSDGDITYNHGNGDVWIFKLKKDSIIEWQKTYGGIDNEYAGSIVELPDSGFLTLGGTSSSMGGVINFHGGGYDDWLLRLRKDNTVLWQTTYGGSELDEAGRLLPSLDGGYIFGGATRSTDGSVVNSYKDVRVGWIVKLKGDSIITTDDENSGTGKDRLFSIHPNPTNSRLYLTSPLTPLPRRWGYARAVITDLNGRTLLSREITSGESFFDVSALPSGIYLFRYQDAERVWNGKFVKE